MADEQKSREGGWDEFDRRVDRASKTLDNLAVGGCAIVMAVVAGILLAIFIGVVSFFR